LRENIFDNPPYLLAVTRAAALLGIGRASAYRLADEVELQTKRLSHHIYVITASLRDIIEPRTILSARRVPCQTEEGTEEADQ
jgi:hypothetical protein